MGAGAPARSYDPPPPRRAARPAPDEAARAADERDDRAGKSPVRVSRPSACWPRRAAGPTRSAGPRSAGRPSASADPANVFPAADVLEVRAPASPAVPVEVGFGGLYGIDAALPAAFHGRIATRAPDTAPLRDFLDLLSHRSYAQLWRAWARYRPDVRSWSLGRRDVHAVRAAALSGIPETADAPVPTRELLPFAARLSAWARNAEGLRALRRDRAGRPGPGERAPGRPPGRAPAPGPRPARPRRHRRRKAPRRVGKFRVEVGRSGWTRSDRSPAAPWPPASACSSSSTPATRWTTTWTCCSARRRRPGSGSATRRARGWAAAPTSAAPARRSSAAASASSRPDPVLALRPIFPPIHPPPP